MLKKLIYFVYLFILFNIIQCAQFDLREKPSVYELVNEKYLKNKIQNIKVFILF